MFGFWRNTFLKEKTVHFDKSAISAFFLTEAYAFFGYIHLMRCSQIHFTGKNFQKYHQSQNHNCRTLLTVKELTRQKQGFKYRLILSPPQAPPSIPKVLRVTPPKIAKKIGFFLEFGHLRYIAEN